MPDTKFVEVTDINHIRYTININFIARYESRELPLSREATLIIMSDSFQIWIPTPKWKFEKDCEIELIKQFWS